MFEFGTFEFLEKEVTPQPGELISDEAIHDAWCSFEGENITDRMHNIKRVKDGDRAIAKAQLAHINKEYPIKYKEEADMVGHFIDKGWLPPEEARELVAREREKAIEEMICLINGGEADGDGIWVRLPVSYFEKNGQWPLVINSPHTNQALKGDKK